MRCAALSGEEGYLLPMGNSLLHCRLGGRREDNLVLREYRAECVEVGVALVAEESRLGRGVNIESSRSEHIDAPAGGESVAVAARAELHVLLAPTVDGQRVEVAALVAEVGARRTAQEAKGIFKRFHCLRLRGFQMAFRAEVWTVRG